MSGFEDVAIVGMSARFPDAPDVEAFAANLAAGRDSVGPPTAERLWWSTLPPRDDYPAAGYLDRIDLFDHRFFGISRREADLMDPHQRLTLELVWSAVEDAGCAPGALRGTKTGVFLTAPRDTYSSLVREPDALTMLGSAPSALPGRVAYALDLRGPAIAFDVGCCASLVAVHAACRELASGAARVAIAGGVAVAPVLEPESGSSPFAEILSADGKCKAFDAGADGAGAGEGGAVVVLKLLRHALEDGDAVHAIVRGTAVNQNGFRSNGLSAPSPTAQAEVIREAWAAGGVDAATVGYIEAHGSGTRLGDVIEVQGLAEAFRTAGVGQRRACAIGSVKTNIGHLDSAAGIAGLVKAVLSLQQRRLFPSLHYREPNPLARLDDAPVWVNGALRDWDAAAPRRAGVSSFSLMGTNAHVVLEEAPAAATATATATAGRDSSGAPVVLPVSAKSA
ncbi:MAG TPA: polyketide synthase, partial [Solirubrobacteraceae bacterium]